MGMCMQGTAAPLLRGWLGKAGHSFDQRLTAYVVTYIICMQAKLRLTSHQQQLARAIWRRLHGDLAVAKTERQRIIDDLQASGMSARVLQGLQLDSFSETTAILGQAAALAENSAIQQEITLHSHRQFILQVCTTSFNVALCNQDLFLLFFISSSFGLVAAPFAVQAYGWQSEAPVKCPGTQSSESRIVLTVSTGNLLLTRSQICRHISSQLRHAQVHLHKCTSDNRL